MPANPAINHPAAWQHSTRWALALLAAPALAALLGLLLLIPLGIERRMAAIGAPALAVVKKCSAAKSGFLVHYEFGHNEALIKGRGWHKSQQERGTGIWVLYQPETPRRNLPYPLTYWRVPE